MSSPATTDFSQLPKQSGALRNLPERQMGGEGTQAGGEGGGTGGEEGVGGLGQEGDGTESARTSGDTKNGVFMHVGESGGKETAVGKRVGGVNKGGQVDQGDGKERTSNDCWELERSASAGEFGGAMREFLGTL